MSWSVSVSAPASEAVVKIADDTTLPPPIREYITDGIEALAKQYGKDVVVAVSGQGHLHTGEAGNYDVTSASINVYRQTAA